MLLLLLFLWFFLFPFSKFRNSVVVVVVAAVVRSSSRYFFCWLSIVVLLVRIFVFVVGLVICVIFGLFTVGSCYLCFCCWWHCLCLCRQCILISFKFFFFVIWMCLVSCGLDSCFCLATHGEVGLFSDLTKSVTKKKEMIE